MERLDHILSKFETTFADRNKPQRNEREGMVLPDRMATIEAAASTTGAEAFTEKLLANLGAKYHDKPPPVSAELRAKISASKIEE